MTNYDPRGALFNTEASEVLLIPQLAQVLEYVK